MRTTTALLAILAAIPYGMGSPHQSGKDKEKFKWSKTENLIAFGDSYTFIQGTAGYPGYSFIGDYLPENFGFTKKTLLTDKIVQNFTGTSAGGPNWVEFLSGCAVEDGEWLPSECDMHLWDFAFAGSDITEAITPLHHNNTTPFVNQTQQYLTYAEPVIGCHMDKSKALVAIWIGINDISDTANWDVDFPDLYNELMDAMFTGGVQPLYNAGYHNFVILNLPPRDRGPGSEDVPQPNPMTQQQEWWNDILEEHVEKFSRKHRDANAMLYDTNTFLNKVLDHPAKYGFQNTTDFCPGYNNETVLTDPGAFGCTPIDGYFWFNSGHIGSHVHELIAEDLDQFLRKQ